MEFFIFFFTGGAAGREPVTHTHAQEPDGEAEAAVEPKITGWLSKRGYKSLDGGVGC